MSSSEIHVGLERQGGSAGNDESRAVAVDSGNAVILARNTEGNLRGTDIGGKDFADVGARDLFSGASDRNLRTYSGTSGASSSAGFSGKASTVALAVAVSLLVLFLLAAAAHCYRSRRRTEQVLAPRRRLATAGGAANVAVKPPLASVVGGSRPGSHVGAGPKVVEPC